jgi:hypothetical protein
MKAPILVCSGMAIATLLSCSPQSQQANSSDRTANAFKGIPLEKGGSASFETVNRHLEAGGDFYLYADTKDDLSQASQLLQELLTELAPSLPEQAQELEKLDIPALLKQSGLGDVAAFGMSSVKQGKSFRNRSFAHIPGGPKGMLSVFDTPNHPSVLASMAPAGTDLLQEFDLNPAALLAWAEALVASAAGEEQSALFAQTLDTTWVEGKPTLRQALNRNLISIGLILKFDPEHRLPIPNPTTPIEIPFPHTLIRIGGLSEVLTAYLEMAPGIVGVQTDDGLLYQSPMPLPYAGGILPALLVRSEAVYLGSDLNLMKSWLSQAPGGLLEQAAYQEIQNAIGSEGNAFAFVSENFMKTYLELIGSSLQEQSPEFVQKLILKIGMTVCQNAGSIQTVHPDGIAWNSIAPSGGKQALASLALLPAAMAAATASAANQTSEMMDWAPEEVQIENNLRTIAAAGQAYLLENDLDAASYGSFAETHLMDADGVPSIQVIDGESYEDLLIRADGGQLTVTTQSGMEVSIDY